MPDPSRPLRRGLPRTPGGEPWPPASAAPPVEAAPVSAESVPAEAASVDGASVVPAEAARSALASAPGVPLRRGLPRVPGGEPWPSAAHATPVPQRGGDAAPVPSAVGVPAAAASPAAAPGSVPPAAPAAGGTAQRRGLPRVPGGEPWPPAGTSHPRPAEDAPAVPAATVESAPEPVVAREPLTVPRTVWAGEAASAPREPAPAPRRYGPFTRLQWAGTVIVGGIALLFAAGMAVALTRWFLSLDVMRDFLTTYPGEYHLPEGAPVGLPAWLGWQHFLNVFFMLLIIRTGLQVRREKRPTVFWSPRRNKKRRISLALWFHQSLDILWIVNGVVFVVLLFVTGQWMRIVPTSWEVFPNALSAALQYVSLDWPTENGWVNYNALQQLAYFATVFVAAPLALVTGVRMSGVWPKDAARLNRAYPVEWARAVHFPVMLYFVVFIAIHVFLVFATGALRNLNHMYAAQGSTDPAAYADNWTGFWFFVASMAVIAAAWIAARPLVLAPIARLFGTVKGR